MAQLGHTDPKFTLRVYTHVMRRGPEERARLKALVYGEQAAAAPPADSQFDRESESAQAMKRLVGRGHKPPIAC
jgi:hypothetical protein